MFVVDIENAFFDLDQYELTDKVLGKGSFGRVQVARKISDGTLYAAKIISVNSTIGTKFQISFMRESLFMNSLEHRAIIGFHGMSFISFEEIDRFEPTILMEYAENGNLETILELEKRGQAPPEWTNVKKFQILDYHDVSEKKTQLNCQKQQELEHLNTWHQNFINSRKITRQVLMFMHSVSWHMKLLLVENRTLKKVNNSPWKSF